MPRRKQSHPKKRRSSIVYRGYKPKFTRRKASALPTMNYCRQRLVAIRELSMPVSGTANLVIPWQQTAPNPVQANTEYITFDNAARWDAVSRSWDQYALTGLRVEYMPFSTGHLVANQTDFAIRQLFKMDDPDSYATLGAATASNTVISAPGFKNLSPYRPFKRYYSLKKLSKQMNVPWQDNQAYSSQAANTLTTACTLFRFLSQNNPGTATPKIGTFKVTWYCKMRGQVNN